MGGCIHIVFVCVVVLHVPVCTLVNVHVRSIASSQATITCSCRHLLSAVAFNWFGLPEQAVG